MRNRDGVEGEGGERCREKRREKGGRGEGKRREGAGKDRQGM
jgi:hypothetical protein